MDKDELKIFVKEKKPLLLVITGAVLILILVLCIFFALRGGDKSVESVDNGAWITAEELEKSGLEILPENPEQVQAIADTASEILTELSAVGSDRETMIQTLREAILGLDYGLTEEEAQELSQWLEQAGFELLAVYGEDSLDPPAPDCQRWIFAARKK